MTEWQTKALGELCEFASGGTPSKDNPSYWEGDVPFVSARDLKSDCIESALLHISSEALHKSATKLAPVGSLLMLVRGMGLANGIQIGEVTSPVAFNQDIRALLPPPSVLPRFLLLALRSRFLNGAAERVLSSAAHGTLKIDADVLRQIPVPIPSFNEQRRVVGILDEAFEDIATAKANAEKNLQNARALFESHLQSVFTRSPGEVPLFELASEITDGDHSPPPKAPTGIPFITISDIAKGTREIDFSNTFTVPEAYFRALKANKKPRVGDILYTVTGATLGIPVLVREQRDFCFQRHIGLVRPRPEIDSAWLTYALLAPQTFRQATIGSTGAAQKTVSLGVLRSLKVPNMPLTDQKRTAAKLDALATETQRLASIYQQKLAALDALKKSLLHQAFSGQL